MSAADRSHDVVVVGSGIAGCTAAILFARHGLSVALLERSPDPGTWKRACTHYVKSGANPTIEKLGLTGAIERAGGIRTLTDMRTRYGWIRAPDEQAERHGRDFNVRRETLDPLLRSAAAREPGVELFLGLTATALGADQAQVTGVLADSADGETHTFRSRLVVAADGRSSRIAELAGLPAKVEANARFSYFAYFRDLPPAAAPRAQVWLCHPEPHIAYLFPTDGGLTVLAAFPLETRLPDFRSGLEEAFSAFFGSLPEGPDLAAGERVSPVLGQLEMPNVSRAAAAPGLALVGDAAMASDPAVGVGCGWAFSSADWLVQEVGDALASGGDLDAALKRYRRRHHAELAGHHQQIARASRGRRPTTTEAILYRAATRDPVTAARFNAYASRNVSPREITRPRTLLRAARFGLRP